MNCNWGRQNQRFTKKPYGENGEDLLFLMLEENDSIGLQINVKNSTS